MKRIAMLCLVVLVAGAAVAMDVGVGVDFAVVRESARSGENDKPTVRVVSAADAVLMLMIDEVTEVSPFIGFSSFRLSDADLAEPVIESQLGLRGGVGYYKRFIRGQHLAFSFGPRLAVTNLFAPSSQEFDTYANVRIDIDALLSMDLSLGDGWLLRFGVPTMYLSFIYERENENVETLLTAGSQLFAGGALVSLRKMF